MCLKIAELIYSNYRQIAPFKSENEDAPPEFETWNLKHGGPKDDTTRPWLGSIIEGSWEAIFRVTDDFYSSDFTLHNNTSRRLA